ncbi:MAG: GNAT family N-acetyltransferase [Gammaproteobacteria bacterium HGW-Gammaproteobacteria-5]|jgi:predicted GNAT family acetyltransferase|nr:MAG: GNAT family N-acetyltransferase [Gammaproteobacteria bacterium HGW-Gammaproteobacteria-5]
MAPNKLDNPIWHSLNERHTAFALRAGAAVCYPADVAPFLGIAEGAAADDEALAALVAPGATVYLLGAEPAEVKGWSLRIEVTLLQMHCPQPVAPVDAGADIIVLDDTHRADVLALTALVYPHYFRPRTMALGRYFGIYRDGRLAAMIGERMGTDQAQEISAVCAHPEFSGQGLARRLLRWLSSDVQARGWLPFLHVSPHNTRAIALYANAGYSVRREIAFWSLCRT